MGGGAGGASTESQSVFYVKAGNENQYKILPLMLTVLIDQDRVQDLLIELENSPMSIQVMEFELRRPRSKVTKPEKGATNEVGMGMGMMGMMGMMGRRGGMGGFGGMADRMAGEMGQMMMMQRSMGMGQMGMGGMGGMGAPAAKKKGTDIRNVDSKKAREEKEKAILSAKGPLTI